MPNIPAPWGESSAISPNIPAPPACIPAAQGIFCPIPPQMTDFPRPRPSLSCLQGSIPRPPNPLPCLQGSIPRPRPLPFLPAKLNSKATTSPFPACKAQFQGHAPHVPACSFSYFSNKVAFPLNKPAPCGIFCQTLLHKAAFPSNIPAPRGIFCPIPPQKTDIQGHTSPFPAHSVFYFSNKVAFPPNIPAPRGIFCQTLLHKAAFPSNIPAPRGIFCQTLFHKAAFLPNIPAARRFFCPIPPQKTDFQGHAPHFLACKAQFQGQASPFPACKAQFQGHDLSLPCLQSSIPRPRPLPFLPAPFPSFPTKLPSH